MDIKKNITLFILLLALIILGCVHTLNAPVNSKVSLLIGYAEIDVTFHGLEPINKGIHKNFTIHMYDEANNFYNLKVLNGYFLLENAKPGKYKFTKIKIQYNAGRRYAYIEFEFKFDFFIEPHCIFYIGHLKLVPNKNTNRSLIRYTSNISDIKDYIKEKTENNSKSKKKESEWIQYPIKHFKNFSKFNNKN